ncbi:amino acid ABC transporter permease [Gynuella sunshinyii]|uniref:ABC-type amino acid transport system, permease component n=1 Tax=Gynuella sunshinyii YC6258 TaxID=1445510 RepID=A0A0C5V042_9GAMM|nr:amino acid ABC transporter permease [Gynuella sunshinyii]AJQ92940.1 ABC-type amino acid transport system, permease component [Gynuella sunshinyii YC6258]
MSAQIDSSRPAKPPAWRDPNVTAMFFQVLVLSLVLYVIYTLINNTMMNLAARGIASGFDFLSTSSGFSISETLIEYDESSSYGRVFWVGLMNTLLVSFLGIMLATVLGFIMGVARLSSNWIVAKIAMIYVDTLRNIPLLLQLFFWYFAVLRPLPKPKAAIDWFDSIFLSNRGLYMPKPIFESGFGLIWAALIVAIIGIFFMRRWAKKRQEKTGEQFPVLLTSLGIIIGMPLLAAIITGFPMSWDFPELKGFNFKGGMVLTPEFCSLLFALSIYTSSFIAEIVRSGIMAVNKGQTEAAYALGLRPNLTTRLIIIPQALRVIIPPLTSQYLNLTKNSSLAAAIAYPDLVAVFAGTTLNQTGQAVEIMAMTLSVYLGLSLLISTLMNWYNARMALVER